MIDSSRVTPSWRTYAAGLLAVFLSMTPGAAQLTTGTIRGTITDPSGALIPRADVSAKNVDTGVFRSTVSGQSGRYEFPSLPGGTYELVATSSGFQSSIRAGIALSLGQTVVVNHTLPVGEVTQSVIIRGEVPLVETTSATVSQLVDQAKIEAIPLPGRDLTQLAFLQPGVMKMPTGTGVFSGLGHKISVAGARGNQNLYLLDGVSNSDFSGNPQSASGSYIGAETIKEFQIITSNYSAEYQSAAGGIISAVTKSGTNSLRGSGFWNARNSALDANSWSNNRDGAGKRGFVRSQFGGSLGGPIFHDRTFFFGSYEGFRVRSNDADTANVFSDATRSGRLPPTELGAGSPVLVDPNVRSIMDLYPRPNTPYRFANGRAFPVVRDLGNGAVTILGEGLDRQPINDDFVGARFDHQLPGEKWGMLSASYNWDDSDFLPTSLLSQVGGGLLGTTSRKHTVGGKLVSVWSPTVVNEINFGYSFSESVGDIPATSQDFSEVASLAGRTLIGDIAAPNVTNIGWRANYSLYEQKTYQIKEGLAISRGDHSLRFGLESKFFRYKQDSCSRGCNGVWTWGGLRSFLENAPEQFEIFRPGHDNPVRKLQQMLSGAYFQDNWQWKPSLTLNLGLRYEFTTVPEDVDGLMAALVHFNDPWVTVTEEVMNDPKYAGDTFCSSPGATPACASGETIDGFFQNPTLKSFSPRVGFAWAPGSHKFSIRGGAGIFYEYPLLFNIRTVLQESPPFVQTGTVNTASRQYTDFRDAGGPSLRMVPGVGSNPLFVALLGTTPNIRAMEYNPANVTIYRWSLTLQQELGRGFTASAGYTGSRGTHLWTQNAANVNRWIGWPNEPVGQKIFPVASANRAAACDPNEPRTANVTACQVLPSGPYNPHFGVDMRIQSPNADSYFHGFAAGLQQSLGQRVRYQIAYNFSKSIDTGSGVTSGGENFAQGQRGVWYWDMKNKRGLSQFDTRRTLITNFTYELPGQNLSGAGAAILGGWQVSGIVTLLDGHPLSVFDTPSLQRNAIGQGAEQNRANLIADGSNNPVLDDGTAFRYYDAEQFLPSFCTGIGEASVRRVAKSRERTLGASLTIDDVLELNIPVCAPGDAEFDPGHFGNAGRNTLTSPGLATLDLSVQKTYRLNENRRFEFRAEFFNLFNRVNLDEPVTAPYDQNGRPVQTFWVTNGQITSAGLPRTVQMGMRYGF